MSAHGVSGDARAEGGKELGIPLFSDRALSRSQRTRWSHAQPDTLSARHRMAVGGAVVCIAALAVAAVVGSVPVPAAISVSLLVPAAVIDVEQRRLPDAWIAAALVALVTTIAIGAAVGRPTDVDTTLSGVIGGSVAMAMPVLILHLVTPASMGFGDVKAAAVLGGAVGTIDWRLGAVALCIAALTGAAVGVATRRRTIAFGPFLVFGAWAALLVSGHILDAVFTAGAAP